MPCARNAWKPRKSQSPRLLWGPRVDSLCPVSKGAPTQNLKSFNKKETRNSIPWKPPISCAAATNRDGSHRDSLESVSIPQWSTRTFKTAGTIKQKKMGELPMFFYPKKSESDLTPLFQYNGHWITELQITSWLSMSFCSLASDKRMAEFACPSIPKTSIALSKKHEKTHKDSLRL